jgi:ribosomal-protein-alanine N-acetyltransferase
VASPTPQQPAILHRGRSLALRRTGADDAPLLYHQMYARPDFMRLFRLNDEVADEAALRRRLDQRARVAPARSGYLELLIEHQRHGAIGIVVAADHAPLHRRAEFLIGLFRESSHHTGAAIEASLLLGDLCFNQYDLHRLYAYSYNYNEAAHRVLLSGGFRHEGVMREHVFDVATQGFVDLHVFGLTVDHFRASGRIGRLSRRLVGRDITQPPPPRPAARSSAMSPSFRPSGSRILRH